MDLPLWGPGIVHKNAKLARCSQVRQRQLWVGKIETLLDIIDTCGRIRPWSELTQLGLHENTQYAYVKLTDNVHLE